MTTFGYYIWVQSDMAVHMTLTILSDGSVSLVSVDIQGDTSRYLNVAQKCHFSTTLNVNCSRFLIITIIKSSFLAIGTVFYFSFMYEKGKLGGKKYLLCCGKPSYSQTLVQALNLYHSKAKFSQSKRIK